MWILSLATYCRKDLIQRIYTILSSQCKIIVYSLNVLLGVNNVFECRLLIRIYQRVAVRSLSKGSK